MSPPPALAPRPPPPPCCTASGTSTYVYRPETGRIFRHIDTWDSISNQTFFSLEGFLDFFRQLLALHRTPEGLETPPYTVLKWVLSCTMHTARHGTTRAAARHSTARHHATHAA